MYFELARVAFLKILAYRLRYFTGILTYFINVSVYYFIWRAIYSAGPNTAGYDLEQIVTYVAVGWIIRSFYFNNIDRDMAAEVSEGKIAVNLIKPVDTQMMYLSQTVGESCFRFPMFTLPIALCIFLVYPVRPPASFSSGALFVASCLLALLISTNCADPIGVVRPFHCMFDFECSGAERCDTDTGQCGPIVCTGNPRACPSAPLPVDLDSWTYAESGRGLAAIELTASWWDWCGGPAGRTVTAVYHDPLPDHRG